MPILYFSWKLNSASTVFQCLQAIAKYQEYLQQQRSESRKIGHSIDQQRDELESLLNNPKSQIKSIEQLESHSTPTPKALGKYIAEATEKLRDLGRTSYFEDRVFQGG